MRSSLANAEQATTALGRAWDAVKRSASDAYDAVGRAIDRAAGGGTSEEQLARIEQRIAALSRGSNSAPSRVLAELRRQADDLRARIVDARHQADVGRIEAEARALSLKVGEAVRDIIPGTETIRQLEVLRGSPIYHFGGIVGGAAPLRLVPAAAFHNAPRFHDGAFLKSDEVPAILQRGERVLNRSEAAAYERGAKAPIVLNFSVTTPDAASFRRAQSQITADMAAALRRAERNL